MELPIKEQFIRFLEADPERGYEFMSVRECALAQFGRSLYPNDGLVVAGSGDITHNFQSLRVLDSVAEEYALLDNQTFGAAARALRELEARS